MSHIPSAALVCLAAFPVLVQTQSPREAWLGWGGPHYDFTPPAAAKLADRWPEAGPRLLWSSRIGGGHSAVLVDSERVYVHYRHGERDADVVAAMNVASGEKLWEHDYEAVMQPEMSLEFGPGPHATPAVAAGRLFTMSAICQLHAFSTTDGAVLWSHDLVSEFGAKVPQRGYGISPVAWEDLVIVNAGTPDVGLIAFDQATGAIRWKSEPLGGGYPTPIPVRIGDRQQLLIAFGATRAGVDPRDGSTLWKMNVDQQSAGIIATPLPLGDGRFLFSAGYGGGARLLEVTRDDTGFAPRELWHSGAMKLHHGNMLRLDEGHVIATSGDFGPAFLMCVNLEAGAVRWRQRGLEKSTMLAADGKLIILEQTGRLLLARADCERFEVISETQALVERAWTTPSLVGARLYVRDYHSLKAFDLSPEANP